MKVRVRAKAGGVVTVTDENGNAIEGLTDASVSLGLGKVPEARLTIKGVEVVVDADADVSKGRSKKAE